MNKKILMFGILGLFAIALVTAGLVNYLSRTSTIEVNVESPMSVTFSDGGEFTDNLVLADTTGLSTVLFSANVKNLANNEIIAPNFIVSLDNGKGTTTCGDLTSIKFTDTWCHGDGLGDCPEQELAGTGLCNDVSGIAIYTIPTVKYKVGQDTNYPVSITFANVDPSTYTIDGYMSI